MAAPTDDNDTMDYELADSKGRPWERHPDSPFECDACGDGDALQAGEECAYCGHPHLGDEH